MYNRICNVSLYCKVFLIFCITEIISQKQKLLVSFEPTFTKYLYRQKKTKLRSQCLYLLMPIYFMCVRLLKSPISECFRVLFVEEQPGRLVVHTGPVHSAGELWPEDGATAHAHTCQQDCCVRVCVVHGPWIYGQDETNALCCVHADSIRFFPTQETGHQMKTSPLTVLCFYSWIFSTMLPWKWWPCISLIWLQELQMTYFKQINFWRADCFIFMLNFIYSTAKNTVIPHDWFIGNRY